MTLRHYVNGSQLDALVFADLINKTPGLVGGNQVAEVTTDEPGYNGSTSIDLAGSTYTQHGVMYPGGLNVTNTSKDISGWAKMKFVSLAGSQTIMCVGNVGSYAKIELYLDNSGNIRAYYHSDAGLLGINNYNYGGSLSIDTWYYIAWTWDNTNRELKVYLDGTLLDTATSSRFFSNEFTGGLMPCICYGFGAVSLNCHSYLDEGGVVDGIIDPTSSGYNLDATSRTDYVTHVPTPDLTWPSAVDVRNGTSFYNGSTVIGSATLVPEAPEFNGYFDLEIAIERIKTFIQANIGNYITQMNTDRSDITLESIDSNAYYFQTIADTEVPYDPFIFFGEAGTETNTHGPEQEKSYTIQVAVILANTNESKDVMGKRLLRYRSVLERMFERGWNKVNKNMKIEVSGISPFPFSLINSYDTHVGIGINLDFKIA